MDNITAKDLMIGDWVSHFAEGKNCVVTELRGRKVAVSYTDDNGNTKYSILLPEMAFEPIPLTAQILKKNGFEKVNGEYQDVFYCCDGLDLLIDDRLEPWGYTLYGVLELPIRYVHELQHALRLCGIDKEIEL